ncbi:uncharacterized protein PV09_06889 [Verruconis gallopava]|uniref:Uncharacterized protein n=1 Tax=Verruconis gallopava TaxID=253628 RepID=A0A0D1YLJ8_9PEZI|nr:uncharacterized protein PV09_06889 [Verruconis gallopava]KIW01712.1 hypothetical protein PV09_06889 [Verruconis gallopava]
MAYIPPHMRKKSLSKAPTDPAIDEYTVDEIQTHYWCNARAEDVNRDTLFPRHSTLNDSVECQGSLSHVILFQGANPKWESDRIIFVKSNLEMLPQYHEAKAKRISRTALEGSETAGIPEKSPTPRGAFEGTHKSESRFDLGEDDPIDIVPRDQMKIACFEQRQWARRFEGFIFTGYFTIQSITLLAPYSKALVQMLEQKWSLTAKEGVVHTKKRRPEDWNKSLSYEWAVVKFAKLEGENVPPPPNIEKLPTQKRKSSGPEKSVNEMLSEMRLGKSNHNYKESSSKNEYH